jgi:hypothetical protein
VRCQSLDVSAGHVNPRVAAAVGWALRAVEQNLKTTSVRLGAAVGF